MDEAEDWALSGDWYVGFSSSNVAAMRYDLRREALHVNFHSGQGGHYLGVPMLEAMDFYRAGSKGGYVHSNLKKRYWWAPG